MKTIKDIYKIGRGPSSSHTMGPERACKIFLKETSGAIKYQVLLYGSLNKTGKGHYTDKVIMEILGVDKTEVIFADDPKDMKHPNTMDLIAIFSDNTTKSIRVESVGGGDIHIVGRKEHDSPEVYYEKSLEEIVEYCRKAKISLSQFVLDREDDSLPVYLNDVWVAMRKAISNGLSKYGILPGGLNVRRKARILYEKEFLENTAFATELKDISSYAYAVSEENADGGVIVTAPTCGSCGVLPAVLEYEYKERNISNEKIIEALAVAGLIGNLVKRNASISGAECGCQAEIGTACAMASAALATLRGLDNDQISCAAEIALEHSLGMTCDPICGLVQVPCIERNAVAAQRAVRSCALAFYLYNEQNISFDTIVKVLAETGKNMPSPYRETGEGGLAKYFMNNTDEL